MVEIQVDAPRFQRELQRDADGALDDLTKDRRRFDLDLNRRFIFGTPVRTGETRASWNLSVDRRVTAPPAGASASAGASLGRGLSASRQIKLGSTTYHTNDRPWASFLDGQGVAPTSRQAPRGITRPAIEGAEQTFALRQAGSRRVNSR